MSQSTSHSNPVTALMERKKVYRLEAFDGMYLTSKFYSKWYLWFKPAYGPIRTISTNHDSLEAALKAYKEHYMPRLAEYITKLKEELQ